jgi:HK97 family phage major capsid protein
MNRFRQVKNESLPAHLQEILDARTSAIERELFEFSQREPERDRYRGPQLNLARMIDLMATGQLGGEDREALEESARAAGRNFDPYRPYVSFRDLSKVVGAAGGYVTGTEVRETVDILRPFSVTARMGMQVEVGLVGDQVVPKVTAKTTPGWFPIETSQGTLSGLTMTQIGLTPKMVGDMVQFSRQFAKQTNAAKFVGNELLKTIGTAIDQAVLNGSGASGQPLGLLNTSGVQTQSGTTLNAGCATMKRKSAEANVADDQITFVSTPAVREVLEGREKATGGGKFVWDKDLVADRPAFVSTDVPTATMICGDWGLIFLGIWGSGFQLEINPYDAGGFKAGLIQGRILVSCDLAVLHPAGFVVATSIT